MKEDSRYLSNYFKFDKIILDSPCSGSGTNSIFNGQFSEQLIDKVVKVQEELLKKAINLVNPGGIIIYSTCSILKEENERIIEKVQKQVEIEPISLLENEKDLFLSSEFGSITICPNENYEGFFIAKLVKK